MGIKIASTGRGRRHKKVRISNTNLAYYIPNATRFNDGSSESDSGDDVGTSADHQRSSFADLNATGASNTRESDEVLTLHPNAGFLSRRSSIRESDSSDIVSSNVRNAASSVTFVDQLNNSPQEHRARLVDAEVSNDMETTLPLPDDVLISDVRTSLSRQNSIRRSYDLLVYRARLNETERTLQSSIENNSSTPIADYPEGFESYRLPVYSEHDGELSNEAVSNNIQFNSNNFEGFTNRTANRSTRSRSSSIHGILRSSRSSSFTAPSNADADLPNQTSINTYNNALTDPNFFVTNENAIDDNDQQSDNDAPLRIIEGNSGDTHSGNEENNADNDDDDDAQSVMSTYQTTLQNTLRNSTVQPDSNTNQILRSRSNSRSTSRTQSRVYSPPPMPSAAPPSPPISRNRSPVRIIDDLLDNSDLASDNDAPNELQGLLDMLDRLSSSQERHIHFRDQNITGDTAMSMSLQRIRDALETNQRIGSEIIGEATRLIELFRDSFPPSQIGSSDEIYYRELVLFTVLRLFSAIVSQNNQLRNGIDLNRGYRLLRRDTSSDLRSLMRRSNLLNSEVSESEESASGQNSNDEADNDNSSSQDPEGSRPSNERASNTHRPARSRPGIHQLRNTILPGLASISARGSTPGDEHGFSLERFRCLFPHNMDNSLSCPANSYASELQSFETDFVAKAAEQKSLELNGGRVVSCGVPNEYEESKLRSFVRRALRRTGAKSRATQNSTSTTEKENSDNTNQKPKTLDSKDNTSSGKDEGSSTKRAAEDSDAKKSPKKRKVEFIE